MINKHNLVELKGLLPDMISFREKNEATLKLKEIVAQEPLNTTLLLVKLCCFDTYEHP